jgi:hypothetical protein
LDTINGDKTPTNMPVTSLTLAQEKQPQRES